MFKSQNALREYTIINGKFFPQDEVVSEQGETNVVLRHLLRKILGAERDRGRARFAV